MSGISIAEAIELVDECLRPLSVDMQTATGAAKDELTDRIDHLLDNRIRLMRKRDM